MTRAVIFDIEGTIIDSVDLHADAWLEALARFDIDVERSDLRRQIGKGADQLLPRFVPTEILALHGPEIVSVRSDLFKRRYQPQVKPFPRVPDLFRRLRSIGRTIVLASCGKAEEIETYAEMAGIRDLVDLKVSADDLALSKSTDDIFQAVLAKIAPVAPQDAIVVGDTAWDVIAARRAGLRTVAVRTGGVPEDELRRAGAVAVYDDLADILAKLETSPLAE